MEFSELIANGTVKLDENFFSCERLSIDDLVNIRIEVLGAVLGVKTEYGEGRALIHARANGKEFKFFTNCKAIKEALSQLKPENFPFFTTIVLIKEKKIKYYKFT